VKARQNLRKRIRRAQDNSEPTSHLTDRTFPHIGKNEPHYAIVNREVEPVRGRHPKGFRASKHPRHSS